MARRSVGVGPIVAVASLFGERVRLVVGGAGGVLIRTGAKLVGFAHPDLGAHQDYVPHDEPDEPADEGSLGDCGVDISPVGKAMVAKIEPPVKKREERQVLRGSPRSRPRTSW